MSGCPCCGAPAADEMAAMQAWRVNRGLFFDVVRELATLPVGETLTSGALAGRLDTTDAAVRTSISAYARSFAAQGPWRVGRRPGPRGGYRLERGAP